MIFVMDSSQVNQCAFIVSLVKSYLFNCTLITRQTDRYFIDRKKVNPDLFVIEIRERYVHVYTTLLIC